jgi:hypothetical protein
MGDKLGYRELFDPQVMADINAIWLFGKEKKVKKKAEVLKLKVLEGGKMQISNYSNDMDILGPFIKDEKHNGEDIHKVINNVHLDYEAARLKRKDIELTIYYRDLLSFLIKNYGH